MRWKTSRAHGTPSQVIRVLLEADSEGSYGFLFLCCFSSFFFSNNVLESYQALLGIRKISCWLSEWLKPLAKKHIKKQEHG